MAAVASHRKPRRRSLTGTTARTAVTLALASAAGGGALEGTALADPGPGTARVKAEVDRLHQEAEEVTEKYNGAREKAVKAQQALDGLRDEAARRTQRLNASRNALGSLATAQYRSGGIDPALQLALSSAPDQYLERASLMDRAGSRQATAVAGIRHQLRGLDQVRDQAGDRLADLRGHQAELRTQKKAAHRKLAAAERLLDRLTAKQRAAVLRQDDHAAESADRADRGAPRTARLKAPNARAAQAVSFAYGALGKPYVWGATGPDGFDCSGLTQASWRAAGVALPRTSYTQINAGQRVPRSELAPGDLVFFYSGISHVGLYIGNGQMIHAPRPGAPVRLAPIDQMPFAGASRPA
ncbi:NlpC/P60 family protein [Streptomyces sp. NPDC002055]|uniref:C40 family peptidase n=1 Tax=Streptomyces sp. NPDC002055 TaxID=3154534 RepID=UPI00332D8332